MAGQFGSYTQSDGIKYSRVFSVKSMWKVAIRNHNFDNQACAKACLKEYGPEQMQQFLNDKGL